MSKKQSQRKQRETRKLVSPETRAADALTVAWMMTVITTVLCGLVSAVIQLSIAGRAGAEAPRTFGRLLHFSAFVAAVMSLVLLGCVLKFRKQAPPASVTWFAVAAAFLVIGAALFYY